MKDWLSRQVYNHRLLCVQRSNGENYRLRREYQMRLLWLNSTNRAPFLLHYCLLSAFQQCSAFSPKLLIERWAESSSSENMLDVQYVASKMLMDIIQEFRYIRNCTPGAHNGSQAQRLHWFAKATLHLRLAGRAKKGRGPHLVPPNDCVYNSCHSAKQLVPESHW